jgi:phage-related protein
MTQYALSYARSNSLANTLATIEITNRSELNEMKALNVGDKVKVVLDNFGTTTQSQIVEGEFDFLLERWNKLTVGESKTTLANLFYNRQKYSNGR